jgi:hypothetical protein
MHPSQVSLPCRRSACWWFRAHCGTIRLRLLEIEAERRITARKDLDSDGGQAPPARVFAAANRRFSGRNSVLLVSDQPVGLMKPEECFVGLD